jgi:hypothetical protein
MMNTALTLIRRSVRVIAIAITGLSVSSKLAPITHAAPQPQIQASVISNREILVTGEGFTPGGYVNVFLHSNAGRLLRTVSRKASTYHCFPTMCRAGGYFSSYVWLAGKAQSDTEIARDVDSGLWSNTTPA